MDISSDSPREHHVSSSTVHVWFWSATVHEPRPLDQVSPTCRETKDGPLSPVLVFAPSGCYGRDDGCCPLCLLQIISMTHCPCVLCQTCFTSFFCVAIKERSVHQLICPQCGQPEIRSQGALEESMDYFNLLDTQVRQGEGGTDGHSLCPDGRCGSRSVTFCLRTSMNCSRGNSVTEPCRTCPVSAGVLM